MNNFLSIWFAPSLNRCGNIISIAFVMLLFFSYAGCGKKGPPVHPDLKPLSKIKEVESNLSGDRLQLTWKFSEDDAYSEPDGFYVYRSKKTIEDDCADCPHIFEKASDISARKGVWGSLAEKLMHIETLEKGYIYRYKVMAYTDSGLLGEFSDVVEITY